MHSQTIQGVILLSAIIVFVIFIVVFSFVLRAFDKRFSLFLKTATVNIKIVNARLALVHDALLAITTILKPSCIEVLRKHTNNPNSELLKDMYLCSQMQDTCKGAACCCSCEFQYTLYALNADEELKGVAAVCKVGDVDTVNSDHGHCPLYQKRVVTK